MPGISLCGELSEHSPHFAFNGDFLGFCPDNPDEPHGDDFNTRCEEKRLGAWVNPHEGFVGPEELSLILAGADAGDVGAFDHLVDEGDDDVEASTDGPEEPRTAYQRFCDTSHREQEQIIFAFKLHVCALIGVSRHDWMPDHTFVLEAIEYEFEDLVLISFARQECPKHLCLNPTMPRKPLNIGIGADRTPYDTDELAKFSLAALPQGEAGGSDFHSRARQSSHTKKKCWQRERRKTLRHAAQRYLVDVPVLPVDKVLQHLHT